MRSAGCRRSMPSAKATGRFGRSITNAMAGAIQCPSHQSLQAAGSRRPQILRPQMPVDTQHAGTNGIGRQQLFHKPVGHNCRVFALRIAALGGKQRSIRQVPAQVGACAVQVDHDPQAGEGARARSSRANLAGLPPESARA